MDFLVVLVAAFLDRRRADNDTGLKIAVTTMYNRQTGLHSAGAASRACNKTANCGNPGFIRNIMGEYYPEMEVYHCEGGKMTRYNDYWGHH